VAIDWDAAVLAPVMDLFGEGDPANQSTWPLFMGGGRTLSLRGAVFDKAYRQVAELADGSQSVTERPVLGVRAALFGPVPPAQGDTVAWPGSDVIYAVADAQPDGHGHILLVLVEAQ